AGENRSELERVIAHYDSVGDREKLEAAIFLIENMPGHYSYATNKIDDYYEIALNLAHSELSPKEQYDSLLYLSKHRFSNIRNQTVQDIKIIKADYLIKNIDDAFALWRNGMYAKHLTYDEFCEWLLPYKCAELQSFDAWRDTMVANYGASLDKLYPNDESYYSTFRALDFVRNGVLAKAGRFEIYDESPIELRSAETMVNMKFGRCIDFVTLGVLAFRSMGLPVVIDEVPIYGRFRAGHSWFTMLNDRGEELASEWDLTCVPGKAFFPNYTFPKIYRWSYAINYDRLKYLNRSAMKYPFGIHQKDVTNNYFRTSDIEIPVPHDFKPLEEYAYLATFDGHFTTWRIVDYGEIENDVVNFRNIGRNILYIALAFNGKGTEPISKPFILHKDGSLEYVDGPDGGTESVDIRRKYFQAENVVEMRRRLLGGRIEASDMADFSKVETVMTIENLDIADMTPLHSSKPYRYWRYAGADGTYGSIAELAFFSEDSARLEGKSIGCRKATKEVVEKAFDDDWLTNFETEELDEPDGAWVGKDFGKAQNVGFVRIVPRSDDNDIHPGDTYELKYWNNREWVSLGKKVAESNILHYDDVPCKALLWVKDYTKGWDERVFFYDNGKQIWW
ncbi:MAG: hypothetical protein HUJ96_03755, partial [Marinilabiliaceae bacterium]|nr:hypothetical protein [Marinilabiliaceae bacterium]